MGKMAVKNLHAYLKIFGHVGKYDAPKNDGDCAKVPPMLGQARYEKSLNHTPNS